MDTSTKGTTLERKNTLRSTALGTQKVQEVFLIDSCFLYNTLLRSIQQKTKNSFIIYDFSPSNEEDSKCGFSGDNVIRVQEHPEFCKALLSGAPEKLKLADLQKLLSKPKDELFSKRSRFYNFIVISKCSKNEFFSLFQKVMNSFSLENNLDSVLSFYNQNIQDRFWDHLLSSGYNKLNEKEFTSKLEKAIQGVPGLGDSEEVRSWRMAMAFQSAMKASKITEVLFYRQSSSQFFRKYPFMKEYIGTLTLNATLTFPNDVFLGRFYFGNWKHASSKEVFAHIGITHVVNVTQEVENYFEGSDIPVKYLKIRIEDIDEAIISDYFENAFNFLNEALQQENTKVLVHCAQGKSRSATIVCVFFMRLFQWSYQDTIKYVSDRRDLACPNHGFDQQLEAFQAGGFLFKGESGKEEDSDENNKQGGEDDGIEGNNLLFEVDKKQQDLAKKWSNNLKAQIIKEIENEDTLPHTN